MKIDTRVKEWIHIYIKGIAKGGYATIYYVKRIDKKFMNEMLKIKM